MRDAHAHAFRERPLPLLADPHIEAIGQTEIAFLDRHRLRQFILGPRLGSGGGRRLADLLGDKSRDADG